MKDNKRLIAVGLVVALLIGVAIAVHGCAGLTPVQSATVTYEGVGTALTLTHDVLAPECEAGTIPADVCGEIKGKYDEARAAYIRAGDLIVAAVEAGDRTEHVLAEASGGDYVAALNGAWALIAEIRATASEYGVMIGGEER